MAATITDAEAGADYIEQLDLSWLNAFTLRVADPLLLKGDPDESGAGMSMILDAILVQGFEPHGYTQLDGVRLYHYRVMEDP